MGKFMTTETLSARLLRHVHGASAIYVRVVRLVLWPKAELLMRLWLAKPFWVSGLIKLSNWQTALYLSAHEYPVRYLSSTAAAYLGVSIELVGGLLLATGLMTRFAAFALLLLTLTIQIAYKAFDNQLFWMVILAWYMVGGAGPLSIDGLVRRGVADSALPFAARMAAAFRWADGHIKPFYLSIARIWLALAVSVVLLRVAGPLWTLPPAVAAWLPSNAALSLPRGMMAMAAALLLAGLGTRYVASVIIVAMFVDTMMDPRSTDAIYWMMVLTILVVDGPGVASLDYALSALLKRRYADRRSADLHTQPGVPRVVILGAGFGGISCAKGLRDARAAVTLVDRTNHHLFQPLLYQVATAGLSPGDIATAVRSLFRDERAIRFHLGEVTGIDAEKQTVLLGRKTLAYDFLVIATGATHSYFGREEWAAHAPGLKRVEDAIEIRRRVLTAFELAEAAESDADRLPLLTFLIVGGGPTGVELAGAIAELAKYGTDKEFRTFDPATARIILVQSAPRLLPGFPESLAGVAQRSLERLGVDVRLASRVQGIDREGATVNGAVIPARTVLWAAGVTASPAARWLKLEADKAGRIPVNSDLSIAQIPNAFAIGDTALSSGWHGDAVPGLASAAKQGGAYVARVIKARIDARLAPAAFRYRHWGSLATIGRKAAVADFGWVKLWGAPAWWLWGLIHLGLLVGVRNRLATTVNWLWAYVTFGGGIRLITMSSQHLSNPDQ
jgi:putative oxidoreductase